MPATKRGIFHNLKESNYTISNTEIMFFFSSQLYLQKFIDEYKQNRVQLFDRIDTKGTLKYLNMETLADIMLYQRIEKRGFRAWLKGVDITCENLHRYALRRMIEANTLDWYVMRKPKLDERIRIME